MDYKQHEEAARRVAASVREAIGRIVSDRAAGHQIVRGIGQPGDEADDPGKPPKL